MSNYKMIIISRGNSMEVSVQEPVTWELVRKGVPGKMTFTVMNDEDLAFYEGDAVRFYYKGTGIFFGYVFEKKRSNSHYISVTAYDQLRYFKNKDTYSYTGKTAAQVLKMVIEDFKLKAGDIDNTKHVIPSRIEDNQDLFTIIGNSLDITLNHTGKMYVMYDNFGSLNLKEVNNLKLDLLIDEDGAEGFDYTSSIDSNTYNQIKVYRENKKTKKREIYMTLDTSKQNEWGILQLTDTLQEGENGQVKADTLLKLYNRKTRNLHINKAFGDVRVRGGSIIGVLLNLGDLSVQNYMMVESVKHHFYESHHNMDLKVIGGDFIA